MLIGEFIHTLDDKKRLSLPARFRSELGKSVVVTRGLDKCLFVYSLKEWKVFAEKLSQLSLASSDSRAMSRFMLSGAYEVEIDSSGRVLIPDNLKEFASLGQRVVVSGVLSRVELWNEEAWNVYATSVESKADSLAEKLGDIGML